MFTALNILFCLAIPCLLALAASYISISALRRHVTFRQLVLVAFVLVASIASVSVLFQNIYLGQAISALPIALISFCFIFSIGQFAVASLFNAMTRLRQRTAT